MFVKCHTVAACTMYSQPDINLTFFAICRFQNKLVMSSCDLCRRHVFRGKVCKYCKYVKFYHLDLFCPAIVVFVVHCLSLDTCNDNKIDRIIWWIWCKFSWFCWSPKVNLFMCLVTRGYSVLLLCRPTGQSFIGTVFQKFLHHAVYPTRWLKRYSAPFQTKMVCMFSVIYIVINWSSFLKLPRMCSGAGVRLCFICWFQCFINYLFAYLTSLFASFFLTYLLVCLFIFLRLEPFLSRPEIVKGDQTF